LVRETWSFLRHITATGSIRTAANELGMAYNRARLLVQSRNALFATCRAFADPVVLRNRFSFRPAMKLRFFLTLFVVTPISFTRAAEAVSVAAAANLVFALDELNAAFKKLEPDTAVTLATGASGNLVAQIKNGAPFDVFLSADLHYPNALIAAGQADAKTVTKFAIGRLVLWTTKANLPLDSLPAVVRDPSVKKLAIANIDTAPYGRAAKQSLEKLGVWTDAQPKIVTGENITQTAQFVETGNADAGLVAMSLVLSPKLKNRGRWIEIPAELYSPLEQAAVLTKRGETNVAAQRFLTFLRSDVAQEIFQRFGYGIPK
jgi:molybdate transport system substrate-binding protein